MPNRKKPPIGFSFSLPNIPRPEIYNVNTNLRVFAFNNPSLEILKIEIVFGNANSITESKTALNLLTSKLLFSGTDKKSAEDIIKEFASHGAFVDIAPSFDYAIMNIYCLERSIDAVMYLLNDVLQNLVFKEDEVLLQKDVAISNLKLQNEKNNIIAARNLRKLLFGNSAYGKSPEINTVEKLTTEEIVHNFNYHWYPTELFISGKVTENVKQSLDLLKSHSSETVANPEIIDRCNSSDKLHINTQNNTQTSLRIGKKIIGKNHDDYAALVMTNYILGGFFGSRLMSNLREDKGLTYGIYSSITFLRYSNFFSIQCDVKTKDKNLALEEINKELNLLSSQLVNYEEISAAKNHYLGSFQNSLSSIYSLSDKYKNIYLYGLQEEFYIRLLSKIEKINPDQIMLTAKAYLSFESMKIVTVGG